MWPFWCWIKNDLITTTRVFDGLWQSASYLSVVLWSYSEKYSGQVRYISQFCSQLSEQIDRLEQTPFSSLDARVFAWTDKRWKGNFLGLTGFSKTIRSDKIGTDKLIKAKKINQETFFSSKSIVEHLINLKRITFNNSKMHDIDWWAKA